MDSQTLSYREQLQQIVNKLDVQCKKLCQLIAQNRDTRLKSAAPAVDRAELALLTRSIQDKEAELQALLAHVDDFTRRAKLIERLQKESEARTQHLLDVQTTLKSAETVLTNCVFQANEKLQSIRQARLRPVDVDTLISCAYRQSRTNAVAAPLTWRPGDPARPYPTDQQMRRGWLGATYRQQQEAVTARLQPAQQHARQPYAQSMAQPMASGTHASRSRMHSAASPARLPFPGAMGHHVGSPAMPARLPFPSAQASASPALSHVPHVPTMGAMPSPMMRAAPFPAAAGMRAPTHSQSNPILAQVVSQQRPMHPANMPANRQKHMFDNDE